MSSQGTYEGTPRLNAEMTTPSHEPRKVNGGIPPGVRIAVIVFFVLVVIGVAYRLLSHASAEHQLKETTDANATPTVNVTHPAVTGASDELALPGNTQAFDDTPIYARTSGYLKKWFVDIGAHVRQGELMATIETPELDEQLLVARAELKSAQAELNLANTTSERYQNLLKQDSVSRQETDVAVSGAAAKLSAVEAAQAAVRRLEQLQSFEKVYAPYSGVVTQRNTDIGDLIDAGSPTTPGNAKELYRIASVNELRIFVAVPEFYSPDIHNGDTATLTLDEYPGQTITGTVTRNSNAIDSSSRTLNVEVDVNNKDGKLLPGAYVFVHFKIPVQSQLLSVPSNALIFRSEGMQVAIVRDGKVHLQHIAIAKDNGKSVEVANGLAANDAIILNPSDSIAEGQQVNVSNSGAQ
jgi:RND family efflux transporter MFP subunit